jgi:lysyl-tRNA synthetase class 2
MSDHVRFHRNNATLFRNIRQRSRLMSGLRRFFMDRGFLEVETPIVCASPGVETHLAAMAVRACNRSMYLTTSPEFHMKRLIAVGFDKVFQVTRAFRDGEAGDRHNPEFTMVEWYRRDADYHSIMDDCEALLSTLATDLNGSPMAPEVPGLRPAIDLAPPYRRLSFRQAFQRAGLADPLEMPLDERFELLVERVEPRIGESVPEFLLEYPADQASLGRLKPGDPGVAERFELYAGGMELSNGFSELTDADAYLARCEADLAERSRLRLPLYPIDERYVSMLRDGMPPCAGTALGFDRLAMLLLGASSIREVLAFPLDVA